MTATRKFVFPTLLFTLLMVQGCNKKKASVPPKMQAPTVAVVLPDELPLTEVPEEPTPSVAEVPPPAAPPKTKTKKPARSNPAAAKKTSPSANPPATQPAPDSQAAANVRPPKSPAGEAAPETLLAAAVPSAKLAQQKEDTARMVDATENALKGINRNLTDEEKSMRSQIQSYLQQSRKATTDGDVERAYNLAKKAQLLAEALIKK